MTHTVPATENMIPVFIPDHPHSLLFVHGNHVPGFLEKIPWIFEQRLEEYCRRNRIGISFREYSGKFLLLRIEGSLVPRGNDGRFDIRSRTVPESLHRQEDMAVLRKAMDAISANALKGVEIRIQENPFPENANQEFCREFRLPPEIPIGEEGTVVESAAR